MLPPAWFSIIPPSNLTSSHNCYPCEINRQENASQHSLFRATPQKPTFAEMQNNNISLESMLSGLNIDELNDMQEAAIKTTGENENTILLSATGSGKTLAYLLPVIQRLSPESKKVQALVLVPSRELAIQIDEVFRKMATGFKVTLCYGGHKRETEENNLKQAPALIIGTPGRVADHIRRGNFDLDGIQTLVLDEFDKSLELGFQEEMSYIVSSLRSIQKRILTSATEAVGIPSFLGIHDVARLNYLNDVSEKAPGDELVIMKVNSPEKDKSDTLFRLICYIGNKSAIVF